ncbi:MAG: hypothetical protein HYX88_01320 [Chloroflexi bacterium]|nr:hypothetical protein [Chloroflexota bacterium]
MKSTENRIEQNARAAIIACLGRVPFVKDIQFLPESELRAGRPDLVVTAEVAGAPKTFVVEVKSSGQPRIAREAANQLLRFQMTRPDAYGVFVAPYISPAASDICRKDGIGCVDFAGNCRLSFGGIYVEREGQPNVSARRRDLRSLYSPRAGRVLRVLLNNGRRTWKIQDLAKESMVSLGQAYNVKKLLSDREWVRTEVSGFSLVEPESLLKEWSENYSFRKNRVIELYSIESLIEFEADLAELCESKGIGYALTGFSGAARLAPTVRYQRAAAYLPDENSLDGAVAVLGLKRVASGANVLLLLPYDEGVFYGSRKIDGVRICSPVQICLDLTGFPGRGEEAAAKIFEDVLRPSW